MSATSPLAKLVRPEDLPVWAETQREAGRSIVMTNGVYDLFHAGHLRSLLAAASHGDVLIVAMNSDASVVELKGPGRPVQDEQAEVICCVHCAWWMRSLFSTTRASCPPSSPCALI